MKNIIILDVLPQYLLTYVAGLLCASGSSIGRTLWPTYISHTPPRSIAGDAPWAKSPMIKRNEPSEAMLRFGLGRSIKQADMFNLCGNIAGLGRRCVFRYHHNVTQTQSGCGTTPISALGSPYSSGKPKARSASGAAAFVTRDYPLNRIACFAPDSSFAAQGKAQLCWHGCIRSMSVSAFHIPVKCAQHRRSWRGDGRQRVLVIPGNGMRLPAPLRQASCHWDWRET